VLFKSTCPKNSRIYTGIYRWRRERDRGPPCGSAVYIWGYVGLYVRRERGREGEREGERGREREKHSQTSSNPLDSTAYQSIDTTSKYYPPEKIIGVRWIH
jgi:hypothetical protein